MQPDIVIRNGLIVDGAGGKAFEADVAVTNGRITEIGRIARSGHEEIDARGQIVTPGFVDVHTHYDGQVTWETRLAPSTAHGVTTVVMGNCGVGFAPCRPGDRDSLIALMEGVEDLPEVVLSAGLPWSWESFPDYLDFLGGRAFDADVATQIPHAALRLFVMGQRAIDRDLATESDRAAMTRLVSEAMNAGALGFATSRTINHRSSEGWYTPTLTAAEDELAAIARTLGAQNRGVMQAISDFNDPEAELAVLRRIVEAGRRPLSLTLLQNHDAPDKWRTILSWIEECNAAGLDVRGQVSGRLVGILLGFDLTFHPFQATNAWANIAGQPWDRKLAALRDPAFRDSMVSEPKNGAPLEGLVRNFGNIYLVREPIDYEPAAADSIEALAAMQGRSPEDLAFELLMQNDGAGMLMAAGANYASHGLEPQLEMLRHPNTIYGLGDGGAHLGFLCDASLPTFMLQHWTRDRTRGDRLALEDVVHGLTHKPAVAVGLNDRGLVRVGYKADLNVIDLDRLKLRVPHVTHDLPSGGRRVTQGADGYTATVVNGDITYRDGVAQGALPGRLVRGPQRAG